MKKIKRVQWLTVLIFILGTFFSCSDTDMTDMDLSAANDEFMVSKTTAESIAKGLVLINTRENLTNRPLKSAAIKQQKEIESILEVPDEKKKAAYFIINYKEGGFVILAGDKRSEPVLAFSETNRFDIDNDYFPTGLVSWLYSSKENIEKIRKENPKSTVQIENQWKNLQEGGADVVSYRIIPPEEPDCTPYTIQKGPFLQTTWGQGCGYNSQTPSMSCGPCNHAWTGCVATAMAQVMKYHQYPASYSWSAMPDSYGTATTSALMSAIGVAVNMSYECNGSGADTQDEVASSFRNDFGYSSATYSGYNYQTVKNELNANRPVILRGGRKSGWWIFSQYKDGHAWVCDGYLNYTDPCWGSMLKYNMNWGWDGTYNGWYSFNNFNPGEHTFNYKTGMVYNIKP
ncbi:C10 family peptidase [Empedobacter brevis]